MSRVKRKDLCSLQEYIFHKPHLELSSTIINHRVKVFFRIIGFEFRITILKFDTLDYKVFKIKKEFFK